MEKETELAQECINLANHLGHSDGFEISYSPYAEISKEWTIDFRRTVGVYASGRSPMETLLNLKEALLEACREKSTNLNRMLKTYNK